MSHPEFKGTIARDRKDSTPWWPDKPHSAAGKPNIVVIYMDDMGFSDVGCYGSEIRTPHIDALAQNGLRFNHYTTHPVCSAARAALLTGRNAHAVGTGWLAHNHGGFPGYTGVIPSDAQTMAEALSAVGYQTMAVGKWHNSTNAVVPDASWPCQRGFQRFYGFMEGETSYFFPARIVRDNSVVPMDSYPEGYYATDDWTDKAIGFVLDATNAAPDRPFYLHLAYNAVHGPLQAKEEDLARYRSAYDVGWDEIRRRRFARQQQLGIVPTHAQLSERDPRVPAWDKLSDEQRALYARHMETYAAVLDCVDQNVGRFVATLRRIGALDNTIIVFSSDNGGTGAATVNGAVHFNRNYAGLPPLPLECNVAEQALIGTPQAGALYPTGWGQVSNTPFATYKSYTGGGGRRVSFLVSWPAGLKETGSVRPQIVHVTDVMPTLLHLAGVEPLPFKAGVATAPIQGASFAAALRSSTAPAPRKSQYYECWANRAYYSDGWVAISLQKRGEAIDFDNWSLHRIADDFSEVVDLAPQFPEKLRELTQAFDREAWDNNVYPLDNRSTIQKFNQAAPGDRVAVNTIRRFYRGAHTVHRKTLLPLIADRSYRIRVHFDYHPQAEGVLFAIGDVFGGMLMYVEEGQLHLHYNGFGQRSDLPAQALMPGRQVATLHYEALGERKGRGRLEVGDKLAGTWGDLTPTLMYGFHEGLDIGIDRRGPVLWPLFARKRNFAYTHEIALLEIETGAFAPI